MSFLKNQLNFIFICKSVDIQSHVCYNDIVIKNQQRKDVSYVTDTIKLKMAITRSGITKKKVAEKLGLSDMGLYKKINNASEFKASEISVLQEMLHLTQLERDNIFFATNVDCKSTKTLIP